ncbi:spherulation-specific family 4 protein [Robbsia sp. KACC 23696]|uniref:spherulation-specific family 4 protein n=1 Tax=Robbsia sp. KACC 23696 TaxID=3149231 RepID=UPI00325C1AD5
MDVVRHSGTTVPRARALRCLIDYAGHGMLRRIASRVSRYVGMSSLAFMVIAGQSQAGAATTTVSVSPLVMPLTVPAYFDPVGKGLGLWNDLATTATKVATTVILNPNSGPGKSIDASYTAAIAKVHAAGGKVIGYVSTSYGKRSLSTVATDINTYLSYYKVDGFFIDEMTSDGTTAHIQYYQSVYNYIKGMSPKLSVMANPGTDMAEQYVTLPTADQFVTFEDTAKKYAKYTPPKWQANYPAGRFVHMVIGATAAEMPAIVLFAATHHAGSLFVTSTGMPNPYKNLGTYWNDLVAKVLNVK